MIPIMSKITSAPMPDKITLIYSDGNNEHDDVTSAVDTDDGYVDVFCEVHDATMHRRMIHGHSLTLVV